MEIGSSVVEQPVKCEGIQLPLKHKDIEAPIEDHMLMTSFKVRTDWGSSIALQICVGSSRVVGVIH